MLFQVCGDMDLCLYKNVICHGSIVVARENNEGYTSLGEKRGIKRLLVYTSADLWSEKHLNRNIRANNK